MTEYGTDTGLTLIVGERRMTPCSHATFRRLQIWLVDNLTPGSVDVDRRDGADVIHIDDAARAAFPHLLNPCECGTYLPLPDIEPGPMLSSAVRLREELARLDQHRAGMGPELCALVEAIAAMADHSLATHTPLEIR